MHSLQEEHERRSSSLERERERVTFIVVCGKENERRRDGFLIKVSIMKRKGETESHCITLHAKWLMEKKREKNTRVFLFFIEVS